MQENIAGPGLHIGEIQPELDSREVDGSIRLDLGSGDKKQRGWISVDIRNNETVSPDIIADISQALPFPDNYADEARAIHIIEHFWPWDVERILKEWVRVLKPGAQLSIECPCLEKVLMLAQVPQCPPDMTYWALYGDPRHEAPEMMHRWCYGVMQMQKLMLRAGLVDVHQEPARFHHPIRDMRVCGYKPIPESSVILTDARGEPLGNHS